MLFIDNKYTRWYNNIISAAQTRLFPQCKYTENHHIVPKSLGGNNSKENLIRLTAKEHFICHLLLTKMTTGSDRSKMANAVWCLTRKNKKQDRLIITNSKTYTYIKELLAETKRQERLGKTHSPETKSKIGTKHKNKIVSELTKQKLREVNLGKTLPPLTDKQKQNLSKKLKGRKFSEETKQKMSNSAKLRKRAPMSEETKKKISKSNKKYFQSIAIQSSLT